MQSIALEFCFPYWGEADFAVGERRQFFIAISSQGLRGFSACAYKDRHALVKKWVCFPAQGHIVDILQIRFTVTERAQKTLSRAPELRTHVGYPAKQPLPAIGDHVTFGEEVFSVSYREFEFTEAGELIRLSISLDLPDVGELSAIRNPAAHHQL